MVAKSDVWVCRNGQENHLIVSWLLPPKTSTFHDHTSCPKTKVWSWKVEVLGGNKVEPSRWLLWEELVSECPKRLSLLCYATKG